MGEHRSTAQEAEDPGTSPERLLELTEKHPQLHRLLALNPSTPDVARQWILATNPWAKKAYEQSTLTAESEVTRGTGDAGASEEGDEGEPTQAHAVVFDEDPSEADEGEPTQAQPVVVDEDPEEGGPTQAHAVVVDDGNAGSAGEPAGRPDPSADADPDSPTVWGDYPDDLLWGGSAAAAGAAAAPSRPDDSPTIARPSATTPPPAAPLGSGTSPAVPDEHRAGSPVVRVSPQSGVVPLGASAASAGTPVTAPQRVGAAGGPAAGTATASTGAPVTAPQRVGSAGAGAAGAGAPSTTAPQQPVQEGDPSSSTKKLLLAAGGCLVLGLVLLLVIALAGRALFTSGEEEYERDSTTTAAEATITEGPTSEEATTEEETPSQDPVSPAPKDAQDLAQVVSPTGNISCVLGEDGVGCSVVERSFAGDLQDCDSGPFSIQVADGDAAMACGSSFLSGEAQTLSYGSSTTVGDSACTSSSEGMTCWNVMTGKGFSVNRSGYETF